MKIACWSGPRNLSTAMMYAFGNRPDFAAVDEPFYAAYLARTGKDHPMRAEILTSQPQDPEAVIAALEGPVPDGRRHVWHKHMTQHMLPGIRRDWIGGMTNVFLIRHPARVVASFSAKWDGVTLEDIGFLQQAALFDMVSGQGDTVVLDADDIRRDPEGMLRGLCDAIGLDWNPAVLRWPAGPRAFDGVWAPHWYDAVHRSTGFAPPDGPLPQLGESAAEMVQAAMESYDRLHRERLSV
ncbi:branched-chain amino acid aminotransferase [Oceanicola sp. 22II-s10i]|uniref:sulfotransferase-like domain-containing protein n=1 Tax=Oceanicola sp. 22II-s10i TaxID=1317116 RepID=UPI000B520F13|nr:sulfotransferase family protein [Oceanicola sp. 22II-s10i]OWU85993.1 branched-chain amino acid aminotransferase [Oceanicola sp. 22II-s10i]